MNLGSRHLLSLVVVVAMTALAAGSKEQKGGQAKGDAAPTPGRIALVEYMKQLGAAHKKLAALDTPATPDMACDAAAMAAKAQKGLDEYKRVRIVFAHGPFMARFASANKADWIEDESPWSWASDSSWRGHFAKHPDARDDYAVEDTARRVTTEFVPRRYHIVVWPRAGATNVMASYDKSTKKMMPGIFEGRIAIVDVVDGSVACHKRVVVESSDTVKYRTGGRGLGKLLDKEPDKAVVEDFQNNMKAQIKAFLPKPFEMDGAMGSLF